MLDVGELVRQHTFELGRRRDAQETDRDGQRRAAAGAATGRERAGIAVGEHVEPRLDDADLRGEPLERRVQGRRLACTQLAGAEHPHDDPVGVRVDGRGQQHDRAEEEDRNAVAAELPAGGAEQQGARRRAAPRASGGCARRGSAVPSWAFL